MSSLTTLARPYAKAAFELARSDIADKSGNLAAWDDMLSAVAAVTADESMARWLQSPFSTAEKAVEIIVEAIGGKVGPRFQGYLEVLADNGRLALCGEISQLFGQLRLDAEKRLQVRVVSAVVLLDSEAERMQSALAKRYDREISLHNEINPEVLGGAIIYAGDQVIDGSLLGRLKRLEASLS
ncbi:MAG: F0F1 ATP synthase subunit delta [Gammaproteobacteria bacterium]|nr:MAG: F0F1 ATP synthase subunit delta [Gammaproteobacteria bacterium]